MCRFPRRRWRRLWRRTAGLRLRSGYALPEPETGAVQSLILFVAESHLDCRSICLDESSESLGYRIGRNYRRHGRGPDIGTRHSTASVQSICRRISALTEPKHGSLHAETVAERLNRTISGWSDCFRLGQVSPAYRAVDNHADRRPRQWLCRKHKVRIGKLRALPEPAALGTVRPESPCAHDEGPSVGEDVIKTEGFTRYVVRPTTSMTASNCSKSYLPTPHRKPGRHRNLLVVIRCKPHATS